MVKDLTTGSPARLIIGFSLPLLAGNLFQQFYSMADTIVVGRSIGVDALAAVGSTGAISFLVLGFVIGLTGGFSVVVAQKFGAGDEREVRRAVAMSVYLSVLLTIVLTAVSVLCTRPLLNFMQTPANIYDDAYAYIVVIFAGTGAIIFYNLLSGVLRALGDSRTPLYFLILSSVINVALDLVFILVFGMGVAGAAYATVAAQVLSGLLCLLYMAKKFPILRFHKSDWAWNGRLVVHHLRLGLPMAFQFSVTAIGVMILQGAINGFGSSVVAGYTAASKVEQLTTQPMMTFGITMATYGGQNLGAGRLDRIRQGTRRCVEISTVVNLACAALGAFLGKYLVRLFLSSDNAEELAAATDAAIQYMNTIAVFFVVLGLLFIFRNVLQGVGSTLVPLLAGFIELVMRTAVVFTLPRYIGYTGVCLANPVAWIGATIPLVIAYLFVMRRMERRQRAEATMSEHL